MTSNKKNKFTATLLYTATVSDAAARENAQRFITFSRLGSHDLWRSGARLRRDIPGVC